MWHNFVMSNTNFRYTTSHIFKMTLLRQTLLKRGNDSLKYDEKGRMGKKVGDHYRYNLRLLKVIRQTR